MKVKELIEKLQSCDPEMMVVRPGHDGGYNDIDDVTVIKLVTGLQNPWWAGQYSEVDAYITTEEDKKKYKNQIKKSVYLL